MMNPKEGEFVYIPSSSKMMLMQENSVYVKKTKILDKPVYVVSQSRSRG